ncbi:transposase [Frankia sp. Cr1]|uniref:transposase n=1 Tax=Frankia sp. Cr1 TaxID=3073931 RepID=UPI003A10222A
MPSKYPNEVRQRAVRLVWKIREEQPTEARYSITTVAQRLGIHPASLRVWINHAETAERIQDLERQTAELLWANEILKGASTFLVHQLSPRPSR